MGVGEFTEDLDFRLNHFHFLGTKLLFVYHLEEISYQEEVSWLIFHLDGPVFGIRLVSGLIDNGETSSAKRVGPEDKEILDSSPAELIPNVIDISDRFLSVYAHLHPQLHLIQDHLAFLTFTFPKNECHWSWCRKYRVF